MNANKRRNPRFTQISSFQFDYIQRAKDTVTGKIGPLG
jgi:hypothetical protein